MQDILKKKIECINATYAEIRFHRRERNQIKIKKGVIETIKSDLHSGVGVRVLNKNSWGFSAVNKINKSDQAVRAAMKVTRISVSRKEKKVKLADVKPIKGTFEPKSKDPLKNHPFEEKMKLAMDLDKKILEWDKRIKSSYISYQEFIDHKLIVTSTGTEVEIFDSKPQLIVGATAFEAGRLTSTLESVGITGGWEVFRKKDPYDMVEKTSILVTNLLNAERPKSDKYTVVLAPGVVGQLCHEAVGHTLEADIALNGSMATDKMGESIASNIVTLVDSGHEQGSGWIPVDDEGIKARRVILIEKGVLRSYLHNRETAALVGTEPTGNARAWEFDTEPIVRMRNTYVERGDWKQEEIIEETKDGLLLRGIGKGEGNTNGEFVFQVQEAYKIEHGEIKDLLRGVAISGNASNVLKTIDAVADNLKLDMGASICYKGQPGKVDGGGPTIRCKVLVAGT